jgi:hypothetical protein
MSATMTLKSADKKPWYKEPWPWILMAGPVIVIVAGVITAWLAVISNDGLVSDDYYKQGMGLTSVCSVIIRPKPWVCMLM